MTDCFVCLAAGRGTRMGRLSNYLQKCMYPLNGIPFVEYTLKQVASLAKSQNRDIEVIFVVGYFGHQLQAYFGTSYERLKLTFVTQCEALGTAHAVSLALEPRTEANSAIVWLADSFFSLKDFVALESESHSNTITLVRNDAHSSDHNRVEINEDQVVRAWHGGGSFVETGLWKMERGILAHMVQGQDGEYRMLQAFEGYIKEGGILGYIEVKERVHLSAGLRIDDSTLLYKIDRMTMRRTTR